MSAEWVTAIATAGTFVVIAASAIAALIQLRHMRGSNQIVALTECRETMETPEFQRAQQFVSYELAQRLADAEECRRAVKVPFEGEYQAISTVANFFESMGLFVKRGIIDKDTACDVWAGVVLRNWNALVPVITYMRKTLGARSLWENFEYLAILSEDFTATHASTLPRGVRRMPENHSLLETVKP